MPNPSRETKFSGTNADREILTSLVHADHVQDWQSYPVDPYSCYMCDHTFMVRSLLQGEYDSTRYGANLALWSAEQGK